MLNIPVWFETKVLPSFRYVPADYMCAFYDLPENQLLDIANYAYERGFSSFLGKTSIALKRRRSNAMPQIITCPACKKAKPESDFALQKNGFRQKRCQTCTERQSRYYYKRKAEKYLTPSEVNAFPPMPEILKPAYWRKYP